MNPDNHIYQEISACAAHEQANNAMMEAQIIEHDHQYMRLIDRLMVNEFEESDESGELIKDELECMRAFLKSEGPSASGLYSFLTIPGIKVDQRFYFAFIVHRVLQFMEHGMDLFDFNDNSYPENFKKSLLAKGANEREVSALTGLAGIYVINKSVFQLMQNGYGKAAEKILRLVQIVHAGSLAGLLQSDTPLSQNDYDEIVKRKCLGSQMLLDQILLEEFEGARSSLLKISAQLTKLKMLVEGFKASGVVSHAQGFGIYRVNEMDEETLQRLIVAEIQGTWKSCEHLEENIKNVIAIRLLYVIDKMNKTQSHDD